VRCVGRSILHYCWEAKSAASREQRSLVAVSGSALLVAVIGVVGLALEARIVAGADTRAVCSGDGRTLATSLACAVAEGCRGLISFGVAGGLSPDLRTGTCVVGSTIISETAPLMTDSDWSRSLLQVLPGAVHGAIVGVSRIVAHPDAKRTLRARTGALAVDNESHIVASAAAACGLPMAAVRVIMDPVTRELPASALAAVRANGTIDLAAVIRSLAREPSDLPMLLRTTLDALIGFAALFRCRQLLGPALRLPALPIPTPGRKASMESPGASLCGLKE
jgi:adenosylhomocysteine nucleosidase